MSRRNCFHRLLRSLRVIFKNLVLHQWVYIVDSTCPRTCASFWTFSNSCLAFWYLSRAFLACSIITCLLPPILHIYQQAVDQKSVLINLLFFIFPEIGIKLLQFLIQRSTSLSCLNRNPPTYFAGFFYERNYDPELFLTLLLQSCLLAYS